MAMQWSAFSAPQYDVFVSRLIRAWVRMSKRRADRQLRRQLAACREDQLKAVGLTRADVESLLSSPACLHDD